MFGMYQDDLILDTQYFLFLDVTLYLLSCVLSGNDVMIEKEEEEKKMMKHQQMKTHVYPS